MTDLRSDLPPLPYRVARLPLDHRGFPVPWFVQWFADDGKPSEPGVGTPDFRVVDTRKMVAAVKQRRCWICGDTMGVHLAFLIGPMCAVNRVTSEPPSHRQCAIFAAKACPFLSRPRMRRNEKDLPEQHQQAAGFHLDRNPGAACVWITKSYRRFKVYDGAPGVLFGIGPPEQTLWFTEGRNATRAEILASIESGLPVLQDIARKEGTAAVNALNAQCKSALKLIPA
jgi:hypothetical protein